MYRKSQMVLALAGIILGLAASPVMAQSEMTRSPRCRKCPRRTRWRRMDKMSKDEKAAMFDKMSDADKMTATKMAGHDMSKMSAHDRMTKTDKMSVRRQGHDVRQDDEHHMDKSDHGQDRTRAAMDKDGEK